jgi:hypothetical protein
MVDEAQFRERRPGGSLGLSELFKQIREGERNQSSAVSYFIEMGRDYLREHLKDDQSEIRHILQERAGVVMGCPRGALVTRVAQSLPEGESSVENYLASLKGSARETEFAEVFKRSCYWSVFLLPCFEELAEKK